MKCNAKQSQTKPKSLTNRKVYGIIAKQEQNKDGAVPVWSEGI